MGRRVGRSATGVRPGALLLLAFVLVGPAAGFSWLGWRSLEREHNVRVVEMEREALAVLERRLADVLAMLDRVLARESERDYYAWQTEHLAKELERVALVFQPSPLQPSRSDPLLRGWFQWESWPDAPLAGGLEVFPPDDAVLARTIETSFGGHLGFLLTRYREELPFAASPARTDRVPLRVVAANEERGQLMEERLEVERRAPGRGGAFAQSGLAAPGEGGTTTPYIESFEVRTEGDFDVRVRVTPFRYLARPYGAAAPHFLVWRWVVIPPDHADRREIKHTRRLLQGYALDLDPVLPQRWEPQGTTHIATRRRPEEALHLRSLVEALEADTASLTTSAASRGGEGAQPQEPGTADPALVLVARVDPEAAPRAWSKGRDRLLLLLGALAAIVVVGFSLLARMIRGELALARRKEDFVAAITHELKTPLTGIRMYAEMLREGWVADPAAASRYAGRILDESMRLGHLVDQVLDLAALERGVAVVHAVPGDIEVVVRESVAWMEPRAKEKGAILDVVAEPNLPLVSIDARLVRPLVLNLVDNALKYGCPTPVASPDEGAPPIPPRVRIGLAVDGDRVELSVSDQGPGIDPGLRRRLFQPFQRATGELTRDAPGIGIGLALVKRYAEAHRARVFVESDPGRGTTVRVRFHVAARGSA